MWTIHKAAFFPSPVRICGVSLMPPTVGHYAILEAIESPFLCGGNAKAGDLLGTVALLSVSHKTAAELVRRPARWGWRQRALAWRMRRKRLTLEDETRRLSRWMAECVWFPERFKDPATEKPSFPSSVPHANKLVWILTEHFPKADVLAMNIIEAHCYALSRAEMVGNQFETLQEYQQVWLPEGYAYHPTEYPEINAAKEAVTRAGLLMKDAGDAMNAAKVSGDDKKIEAAKDMMTAARAENNKATEAYKTACLNAGGGPYA
jgi:hypothetical protein